MRCHLSRDLNSVRKESIWITERLLQIEWVMLAMFQERKEASVTWVFMSKKKRGKEKGQVVSKESDHAGASRI